MEVRSQIAPLLVARVRSKDPAVADAILERCGLPKDADALREIAIPLATFRTLCDAAAAALGDPFAGLNAAVDLPRGTYGLVEFVFRSAPTVGAALEQLVRYAPLINNLLRFDVTPTGRGRVLIVARVEGEPECLGRQANEFSAALFLKVGRQIAGRAFAPARVWFAHGAPPDVTPLARFFGTKAIVFGAEKIGLELDAALLDVAVPTADVALYSFLDRDAQERAARLGPGDDLEAVREKVRVSLRQGEPAIEPVAAMLGMSPRSLQRRLAERGTTFRGIVDEVRASLASLYLDDHALPLTEVAFLLGYSDARAFVRAHKRWTGTTPAAARAR